MTTSTVSLSSHIVVRGSFEATYERIRLALKAAGFEIVAEINLAELLARKSGTYNRPYKIAVVVNTDITQRALTITPEIGVVLPCNVVVSQIDDDHVEIRSVDPVAAWNIVSNTYLKPIAEELNEHLKRVLNALKG